MRLQDEDEEAAAGVARDDGDDHAIDFITGSRSFMLRKSSASRVPSHVQSPLHLSQSRTIYVRV
jgi:hypothetical protein